MYPDLRACSRIAASASATRVRTSPGCESVPLDSVLHDMEVATDVAIVTAFAPATVEPVFLA